MDEFDDIDNLLDFEADLLDEAEGDTRKRNAADVASQRDAAASLSGHDLKRLRTEPLGGSIDDEELLQLAERVPLAPSGNTATAGASGVLAPEDEEIFRLALMSQPSQGALPAKKPGAGAPRQQPIGADDIDDELLAMLEEDENADKVVPAPIDDTPQEQPPAAVLTTRQALDTMLPGRPYIPAQRDVINVGESKFMTVTSEFGERVYVPISALETQTDKVDIAGALRRARGTLLSTKIEDLLEAVEKDQYERALAETAAADGAGKKKKNTSNKRKKMTSKKAAAEAIRKSSLWVEKYAPDGFFNLLSDDQLNRDILKWLKTWDPCVFGTPSTVIDQKYNNRGKSKRGGYNNSKYNNNKKDNNNQENADPLGRPQYRAILLAGPPGLGKTTLAHVVARHCGYRPVEINASDDRSGSSLMSRVLDAVEMKSVMGEKRPNCLIIDEIDGAAGGNEGRSAISALVKIITATATTKVGNEDDTPAKGKKNRKIHHDNAMDEDASDDEDNEQARNDNRQQRVGRNNNGQPKQPKLRPLLRPIICICNDLYAPALRPLRDVAQVFHFRRPSAERLAERLYTVCAEEGLQAEKSTLRMLAERAECDVRSCLNTLQFLSKRQKAIRSSDLAGLNLGLKDMTKGAFQVWGELLQRKKAPSIIGKAPETVSQRQNRLYNMLLDFGESDLVVSGLHESLPQLKFFDMGLHRTAQVLSSMQDADTFMRTMTRSGDFSLMKYLPAPMMEVGNVVAGPERPQISWPRSAAETRRKTAANREVVKQWLLGMSPMLYAGLGAGAATMHVLPLLPGLTTPALRPVSRHLFSREEQSCVDSLIDTMISLGLRFSMEVEEMDAYGEVASGGIGSKPQDPPLQFRPPVHRLWHFRSSTTVGGAAGSSIAPRTLAMPTRQMVLHETDMEAIRRQDAARRSIQNGDDMGCGANNNTQTTPGTYQHATQQRAIQLDLAQRLREAGVTGKTAKKDVSTAPKGTWLDQMREKSILAKAQALGNAAGSGGVGGGEQRFSVLYKFHEGYTNAVKRPVLMFELLK